MPLLLALAVGAFYGISLVLPVSASGHLLIPALLFPLLIQPVHVSALLPAVQAGAILGLVAAYAGEWRRMLASIGGKNRHARRTLSLLLVALVPIVLVRVFLHPATYTLTPRSFSLALSLSVTAAFLMGVEFFRTTTTLDAIGYKRILVIGLFHALSLVPGSSSIALATGSSRMMGLSRRESIDFAFLLITASLILAPQTAGYVAPIAAPGALALSFAASAATTWLLAYLLHTYAARIRLAWFALYLFALSILLFVYHYRGDQLWDAASVRASLQHYGAFALFVFAVMEVIPPLSFVSPGIFVVISAGALIASTRMGILFFVAAAGGLMTGNTILFFLGRWYGRDIAHAFYLTEKRLKTVDTFMARFGRTSVFLGQFVNAVRPFVAFVAGTSHLRRDVFFIAMMIGCLLWTGLLLGVGFFLRDHLTIVLSLLGTASTLLLIGAVVFLVTAEKKIIDEEKK